jgi:hypothetical protein
MGADSPVCLKQILLADAPDLSGDVSEPVRSDAGIRQPRGKQKPKRLFRSCSMPLLPCRTDEVPWTDCIATGPGR